MVFKNKKGRVYHHEEKTALYLKWHNSLFLGPQIQGRVLTSFISFNFAICPACGMIFWATAAQKA